MPKLSLADAVSLALDHVAAGRLGEAAAVAQSVLAIEPALAEAHRVLGLVAHLRDDHAAAAVHLARAAEGDPDSAIVWDNLSLVLRLLGRFEEAENCSRRAIELDPASASAHCNLAVALDSQGRLAEARAAYADAMRADPSLVTAYSNFIRLAHYDPGVGVAEIGRRHAEWDRRFGAPLRPTWRPHANSRDSERPLRLGFVSPDFGNHPVGYFLTGVLEHLDRSGFAATCYSCRPRSDPLTARLKSAAAGWREVRFVADEPLAELIRADRIDLLFDLAGHTAGNRLTLFARKPAPLQLTWMGYTGTTGLEAMDYLVADRFQVAPGTAAHYSEQILALTDGYVCYLPPDEAPAVGPLPAAAGGPVTFGCFNNPMKLGPQVVRLWAELLRRAPTARLLLKYNGYDQPRLRSAFFDAFAREGIETARLEMLGWSSREDLLGQYGRVDVALDPFPYSGGLTTLEALWMGVPVVTRPGETFASRHSLSHLSNAGLGECVAASDEEYIAIALRLACDVERLAALRAGLRQRMAASPLCDRAGFCRGLAAALRRVWRRWCRGD